MRQVDTGVVDQHVKRAEPLGCLVDHRTDRLGVRHVRADHGVSLARSRPAPPAPRRRRPGSAPPPGPRARERARDRRADTARPAGYQNSSTLLSPARLYPPHSQSALLLSQPIFSVSTERQELGHRRPVARRAGGARASATLTIRISAAARSLWPNLPACAGTSSGRRPDLIPDALGRGPRHRLVDLAGRVSPGRLAQHHGVHPLGVRPSGNGLAATTTASSSREPPRPARSPRASR